MLAFVRDAGQHGACGGAMEDRGFSVMAVTLFGKWEVARLPTREQAELRVRKLRAEAERSPRGYVEYVVRPMGERSER